MILLHLLCSSWHINFSKVTHYETCHTSFSLLQHLREEYSMRLKGGIYHLTQVKLCYNSNRIEGSQLSEEQTRHIFETATLPDQVPLAMQELLADNNTKESIAFEDIIDFHWRFERIHPFQDGNGRVGRLITFKECLKYEVVHFIIDEQHKAFYYRGLAQFANIPEYPLDTCRSAQDTYAKSIAYF